MKYKRIIHDKSIFLLILSVTMTLAFFTFGVIFYLSVHDDGKMNFHYENEKVIMLVGREEISETETAIDENGNEYEIDKFVDFTPPKNEVENVIENLCGINHCNVSIDVECNVGPAREQGKAKIYLNHAEDVSERLMQDYFEYSETSEPYAFVGSEILYMIKDGTINVNAQDIRVAGVLENETIHDDSRIVLMNAMKNPGIKEVVINTFADTSEYSFIHFGSNMEPFIHTDWETTKKDLKRLNRDVEVQDKIPDIWINGMDETLGKLTDKILIGLPSLPLSKPNQIKKSLILHGFPCFFCIFLI